MFGNGNGKRGRGGGERDSQNECEPDEDDPRTHAEKSTASYLLVEPNRWSTRLLATLASRLDQQGVP